MDAANIDEEETMMWMEAKRMVYKVLFKSSCERDTLVEAVAEAELYPTRGDMQARRSRDEGRRVKQV